MGRGVAKLVQAQVVRPGVLGAAQANPGDRVDAGGVLEFVTDTETGLVAEPEPEALAAAMDRLWGLSEARLREMGEAAQARVAGISWDHVIDRLTESLR